MPKKITDLPTLSSADSDDLVPIVDVSGNVTKKVPASGLVPNKTVTKTKLDSATFVNRRNISTNATVDNFTISTGWFYIQGNGSVSMTASVAFPQEFTSAPIVIVSYAGASGSVPTQISDLTSNPGATSRTVSVYATTTAGFSISLVSSASVGTGVYLGVTWTAVGSVV